MRVMKNLVRRFLKLFYNKLSYRGMYAIHSGDRVGSFFVYIEEEDKGSSYALLMMPNPTEALYVRKDEIESDLKYDNIMFYRKIPAPYYESCKAQFLYYAKKAGIHE